MVAAGDVFMPKSGPTVIRTFREHGLCASWLRRVTGTPQEVGLLSDVKPVWVAGVPVVDTDLLAAVKQTADSLSGPDLVPTAYRFVNSYSIALARSDAEYRHLLANSGVNFADGKPLAKVVRHLVGRRGARLPHVRGPSYFERLLDQGRANGLRHFFLGSTPDTLAALLSRLEGRYPGLEVVGAYSPPFRAMTDDEQRLQDETIVDSRPDIVWVGLGTPKQDYEADRIVQCTGISAAAVGAAFDFTAGTKPEAPGWMRALYVEWLFRLSTEPRRLWRRYLVGNVRFVAAVVPDLLRGQRP